MESSTLRMIFLIVCVALGSAFATYEVTRTEQSNNNRAIFETCVALKKVAILRNQTNQAIRLAIDKKGAHIYIKDNPVINCHQ